jgi:hypothetical protein
MQQGPTCSEAYLFFGYNTRNRDYYTMREFKF